MENKISLYVHIPFCVRKCAYCDFLSAPATEKEQEEYVEALVTEIGLAAFCKGRKAASVYFGGGTPSILRPELMERIMDSLREHFCFLDETEVSVEVNPGTVTREKLERYRKAGINRLSIGLQSVSSRDLEVLGRIHTYEDFLETYRLAREAGFQNISADLMAALPGQSVEEYLKGLKLVAELGLEHISAYSLIVEEGTPFYERYYGKEYLLPTEDEDREMYVRTREILEEFKYTRYEISNYAQKGYECRHNMVYWMRDEYMGFGVGSASLVEETRYRNIQDVKEYIALMKRVREEKFDPVVALKQLREEVCKLTEQEQMEEFMFLGLRLIGGRRVSDFQQKFGKELQSVYEKQLDRFQKEGCLTFGDCVKLTEKGLDISNYVMSEFLL